MDFDGPIDGFDDLTPDPDAHPAAVQATIATINWLSHEGREPPAR